MSSFDISKSLPLDFLGEAWKDCYLKFSYIAANESKEIAKYKSLDQNNAEEVDSAYDKLFSLIQDKFIEGKAIRKGEQVEVKKEDLADFPQTVIMEALQLLIGEIPDGEKKGA